MHKGYRPTVQKGTKSNTEISIAFIADGVNIHNIHEAENNDVLRDRLNYIINKTKDTEMRIMAFSRSLEAAKLAIRQGLRFLFIQLNGKSWMRNSSG